MNRFCDFLAILKVQLESCKQDLIEKTALLTEASNALDDLQSQVESQKDMINSYEEKVMDKSSMFELGSVPKAKRMSGGRSPDVSRKPLMSPKITNKNIFFSQEDIKKEKGLFIVKEDEEMSEGDVRCKEYLKKIKNLEDSLKLSLETQRQLSESLERTQAELDSKSSRSLKAPFQIEIDTSILADKEIKFEFRKDCSSQTTFNRPLDLEVKYNNLF